MSTLTPIKPRHQQVARQVADTFGVDAEDALNAIRRGYGELRDFFAGAGPAHVFVFHQPRGDAGGDIAAAGAAHAKPPPPPPADELFFSTSAAGCRAAQGRKVAYLLRCGEGPVDLDKVRLGGGGGVSGGGFRVGVGLGGSGRWALTAAARQPTCPPRAVLTGPFPPPLPPAHPHPPAPPQASDGSVMYGEVAADPLESLSSTLGALFQAHAAERTDWGRVDAPARAQLTENLDAMAAALSDAAAAGAEALPLAPLPPGVDLGEAVRATQPRAKPRKSVVDADAADALQREWARVVGAAAPPRDGCARGVGRGRGGRRMGPPPLPPCPAALPHPDPAPRAVRSHGPPTRHPHAPRPSLPPSLRPPPPPHYRRA